MKKYPGHLKIIHIIRVLSDRIKIFYYTVVFRIKIYLYRNTCAGGLKVYGKVFYTAQFPSRLKIGENFIINSSFNSNLVGLTNYGIFQIIGEGRIEIGNNCGFSSPVLSSRKYIKIGNHVMMGGNVRVFDHDYHSMKPMDRRDPVTDASNVKAAPVVIDDDVFIGTNAIILKGVHIGARSIIGAGAVVSLKNIPPDSLVVGNPAKIVK